MVDEKEKAVSEERIDEALNKIMDKPDNETMDLHHTIKFIAKILFNVRFDLNELKTDLLGVLGEEDDEPIEYEYLPESDEDLEKIEHKLKRLNNGFYS